MFIIAANHNIMSHEDKKKVSDIKLIFLSSQVISASQFCFQLCCLLRGEL